ETCRKQYCRHSFFIQFVVSSIVSCFLAAVCTAFIILVYPVHRQRLPPSAVLTSSSVGTWFIPSKNDLEDTINPGVQYPHCVAPSSTNACCTTSIFDVKPIPS